MSLQGLLTLLLIALLIWCAFALYLFILQPRLLYYPDLPGRGIVATPVDIGLDYEAVTLTTADGVHLAGWSVPHPQARATLLFLHGNAGNISHRLDSIRLFHDLGLAVFIIDYRGYGESEGRPTEDGTYRDAAAAWDYLVEQRQLAPRQIVLFGRSLGGAVAADLASRTQPAALIIESTFTSVPDMAATLYPWLPVRWLSRFRYDTGAKLAAIAAPLLIAHSADDEIIPYAHGRRLFELARRPKQFLELRGGHNDGFLVSGEHYVSSLDAFLEQYLSGDRTVADKPD
jgi:fermentation-respiration switch protein FrsA (DUF1100 family)